MKRISNLVFAAVAVFVMVGCNTTERKPGTITQSETNERDCVAHLYNGIDVHLDSWTVKWDMENTDGLRDTISICKNVEWEMERIVELLDIAYTGYSIVPNSDYNKVTAFSYKHYIDGDRLFNEWQFEIVSPQSKKHYLITFKMNWRYSTYDITNIIIL